MLKTPLSEIGYANFRPTFVFFLFVLLFYIFVEENSIISHRFIATAIDFPTLAQGSVQLRKLPCCLRRLLLAQRPLSSVNHALAKPIANSITIPGLNLRVLVRLEPPTQQLIKISSNPKSYGSLNELYIGPKNEYIVNVTQQYSEHRS